MSRIRISAASLARIEINGNYLVGLNKKKREIGRRVYTPYGGVLQATDEGRSFLDELGAEFTWKNNLRLYLDNVRLPDFEAWFYSRIGRETSPYRELREELVDEDNLFSDLPEDAMNLEYLTTVTECEPTTRPGNEGEITQRYLEITNVIFVPEYQDLLLVNLRNPRTYSALVRPEEIVAGRTDEGIETGSNCLPLIG